MRSSLSATNPATDEEIIDILRDQARFKAKYPDELFVATRAAFLARVEEMSPDYKLSSEQQLPPTSEQ